LEQAVATFRQILRQAWVRRAVRMLVSENRQDELDRLTLADVQRYRDAMWLEKERAYHTRAVDELNALVRKYNGLAPYAVRRAYHTREAEVASLYDECASDIFKLVSEQKTRSYLEDRGAGGGSGSGGSSGGGQLGKMGGNVVVSSAFFEWLRLLFRRWFKL
jgi:DnaJ homolog subfamily C member 28